MVNKNFHQLIQETKLIDKNSITYKEAKPFNIQDIEQFKLDKKTLQSDSIPDGKEKLSNFEDKEVRNEIKVEKEKEEQKNEIKEEPKNEIRAKKEIQKEEAKNEIKIEAKEEKKVKKKKNRHKKNKKEKGKIFEIPKTNPYKDLFDFKEVSKLRFQDNSIFRVINNWEEKEWLQTTPPTKDIDELFPNQIFPQGEIQPYSK